MPFAVLRAKQYKCESLEILEAFFLTLAGATVASVWDDIFHHPDDETVLDDTLAYVRWMHSGRDAVSTIRMTGHASAMRRAQFLFSPLNP